MTDDKGSWWRTLPGMVTAIAGAVTAICGLLVTLHQIGVIGARDEKPPSSVTTGAPTTGSDPAAAPQAPATQSTPQATHAIDVPAGSDVTLRSSRAVGTYQILSTRIEDRHTGTLVVTISVRLTNAGPLDLSFGTSEFRMVIDGVPRAPTNWVNSAVDGRSAKDAELVFEVPDSAGSLVLAIDNGEDRANIPLVLRKSD